MSWSMAGDFINIIDIPAIDNRWAAPDKHLTNTWPAFDQHLSYIWRTVIHIIDFMDIFDFIEIIDNIVLSCTIAFAGWTGRFC